MGHKMGRAVGLCAVMCVGAAVGVVKVASGVQAPHAIPATHERQCVSTGKIPPGDARTITVAWKHAFATENYNIIGSVAESGDSAQAIELSHIVIPHSPTTAAAVVLNRNATEAESAVLCLDASAE